METNISHYVWDHGVNGVDTPDLFSAETDRFPAVSKRLNACKIMPEME